MDELPVPHGHVWAALAHIDATVFEQIWPLNDADTLHVNRVKQFERMAHDFPDKVSDGSADALLYQPEYGRRLGDFGAW